MEPERVGIHRASVFNGFCRHHDSRIFEPIEHHPFEGSAEQSYLLYYRAWMRKTYSARSRLELVQDLRRNIHRGPPLAALRTRAYCDREEPRALANYADALARKAQLDQALRKRDFGVLETRVIWIVEAPQFVFVGVPSPDVDLIGRLLYRTPPVNRVPLLVSVVQAPPGGAVVLGWLRDDGFPGDLFAESISLAPNPGDALAWFGLGHLENICVSPAWWDALSAEQRSQLAARFKDQVVGLDGYPGTATQPAGPLTRWTIRSP
jgi:hypothetical protein